MATSSPSRSSPRSSKGRVPVRLGQGDGWGGSPLLPRVASSEKGSVPTIRHKNNGTSRSSSDNAVKAREADTRHDRDDDNHPFESYSDAHTTIRSKVSDVFLSAPRAHALVSAMPQLQKCARSIPQQILTTTARRVSHTDSQRSTALRQLVRIRVLHSCTARRHCDVVPHASSA
jgi:hypothetical protein